MYEFFVSALVKCTVFLIIGGVQSQFIHPLSLSPHNGHEVNIRFQPNNQNLPPFNYGTTNTAAGVSNGYHNGFNMGYEVNIRFQPDNQNLPPFNHGTANIATGINNGYHNGFNNGHEVNIKFQPNNQNLPPFNYGTANTATGISNGFHNGFNNGHEVNIRFQPNNQYLPHFNYGAVDTSSGVRNGYGANGFQQNEAPVILPVEVAQSHTVEHDGVITTGALRCGEGEESYGSDCQRTLIVDAQQK